MLCSITCQNFSIENKTSKDNGLAEFQSRITIFANSRENVKIKTLKVGLNSLERHLLSASKISDFEFNRIDLILLNNSTLSSQISSKFILDGWFKAKIKNKSC